MCAEVSSSAPHFIHKGLSISPIMYEFLLSVVLSRLKASNHPGLNSIEGKILILAVRLGPEINSQD